MQHNYMYIVKSFNKILVLMSKKFLPQKASKYNKSHLTDPLVTKKCVLEEVKNISILIITESKTAL